MILHMLIAMIAGWIQDHQQQVIEYLREDNRVLKAQLGGRRLRLTETERRRLATLAYPLGRPRVTEEIEQLVVRMAEENATWGYRRIQGALANPGHSIDAITVRNILCRHHMEPAPQRRKPGMSWTQLLQAHGEVLAATFPTGGPWLVGGDTGRLGSREDP
jgi:hypothetical protein